MLHHRSPTVFDDDDFDDDIDDDIDENELDGEEKLFSPPRALGLRRRRDLQPRVEEPGPTFPSEAQVGRIREHGTQDRFTPDESRELLDALPSIIDFFMIDRVVQFAKSHHQDARLGQPWTSDERQQLIDRIQHGRRIPEMARRHERSDGEIQSESKRLVARGLLSSDDADWLARYEATVDAAASASSQLPTP